MKALIVVDYQYDFANPKGSLYWPQGETLEKGIRKRIEEVKNEGGLIIFTQDWHPEGHSSFGQWPVHCIQNSLGAELVIEPNLADFIVKKGTDINFDSYSAFSGHLDNAVALDDYLKQHNVTKLEICGLVKEICVNSTYRDAIKLGYEAFINEELTK